jgi:RNA polymerase sigma factor (sigma-70 family)
MAEETISQRLQSCLDRFRGGDQSALHELWDLVNDRLTELTRRIKRGNFSSVGKWSQTEDIAQDARLRLLRALGEVAPATVRDFYGLANLQIRRELLDTIRQHTGRHGERPGISQFAEEYDAAAGDTLDPQRLAAWQEFHQAVGELPPQEREAFELCWYQELSQDEAAEILGVDKSTVKRRFRAARSKLAKVLPQGDVVTRDDGPPDGM